MDPRKIRALFFFHATAFPLLAHHVPNITHLNKAITNMYVTDTNAWMIKSHSFFSFFLSYRHCDRSDWADTHPHDQQHRLPRYKYVQSVYVCKSVCIQINSQQVALHSFDGRWPLYEILCSIHCGLQTQSHCECLVLIFRNLPSHHAESCSTEAVKDTMKHWPCLPEMFELLFSFHFIALLPLSTGQRTW